MSRIRSIHPGQWTDEAFVECSAFARLLALGVRNEADDNGVFEWRPTRLKMRIFPADAIDVPELLAELEDRGLVLRFEVEDRTYGAIRNFRVYQNPRSPKAEHPLTPDAERFVGDRVGEDAPAKRGPGRPRKAQDAETSPVEAKSFPQNVENNSVMERRGEERSNSPSDSSIGEPIDAPPVEPSRALVVDEAGPAFAAYEALRHECVPSARTIELTAERRKKLVLRLKEVGGPGGWNTVLAQIRGSPFLRGDNRGGKFIPDIDWLLTPANFRKVREGNYDERPNLRRTGNPALTTPVDAARIARARLGLDGP